YQWEETINEFPMFSFLLADMHPHVMTLPTALLVISFGLAVLTMPIGLLRSDRTLFFVTAAVAIGALYFLNTWDYPTYLLLFVLAALVRERLVGRQEIQDTPQESNPWLAAGKVAVLGGSLPHPQTLALG